MRFAAFLAILPLAAGRSELLPYNPLPAPGAAVTDSAQTARFTVLTDRLLRMELASAPGVFEDRATLAFLNRALPVPAFSHAEAGGVLTVNTSSVSLAYVVGSGAFTAATLAVTGTLNASVFRKWQPGDFSPGNLLGTIRGLDHQRETSLNCTTNRGLDDNGESNHCEWGIPSRDGWTIVNDTRNYVLGADDWWAPAERGGAACPALQAGVDVADPVPAASAPRGVTAPDAAACCAACAADATCLAGFVFEGGAAAPNCWPLAAWSGFKAGGNRSLGAFSAPPSAARADLYGFFHGLDFAGALQDFVLVSGRAAMVPRFASGVLFSRWYDYSAADAFSALAEWEARRLPLDAWVMDVNWHLKNDWSGFTFDPALYPDPADTLAGLRARGVGSLVNIHDADGVGSWEALFPQLAAALGLPANASRAPLDLLNATAAHAAEDIVVGDLLKKGVDAMWIDWQSGGAAGGLLGDRANPSFWLAKLRATSRARVGDATRGLVLARFGGLGHHRYQVGFTGDVFGLDWPNMAYQPYFSATAANVGHAFISHDIVGPAGDEELFARWVQAGAFSGVMRLHDRGLSSGACNNVPRANATAPWAPQCAILEPWALVDGAAGAAVRAALQLRAELVPYIYTRHRAAFDTGVGLVIPMYYRWPGAPEAYLLAPGGGNFSQYMFGPHILFSPVNAPGGANAFGPGLAQKTTWLPPGGWYDSVTGALLQAPSPQGRNWTGTYAVAHVPLFYAAGAAVPFLPLRSLPTTLGAASARVDFLGWRLAPPAAGCSGGAGAAGGGAAYEDDGATTAYFANASAVTTLAWACAGGALAINISTAGAFPQLPAARAHQLRLLNGGALARVTANGAPVPFSRHAAAAAAGRPPAASAWWWELPLAAPQGGMGAVIDLVGVPTDGSTLSVEVVFAPGGGGWGGGPGGEYGAIARGAAAKTHLDLDRSTPDSQSPGPGAMARLATAGEALAALAGAEDAGAFGALLAGVGGLRAAALAAAEGDTRSPRANFSAALLGGGW